MVRLFSRHLPRHELGVEAGLVGNEVVVCTNSSDLPLFHDDYLVCTLSDLFPSQIPRL